MKIKFKTPQKLSCSQGITDDDTDEGTKNEKMRISAKELNRPIEPIYYVHFHEFYNIILVYKYNKSSYPVAMPTSNGISGQFHLLLSERAIFDSVPQHS